MLPITKIVILSSPAKEGVRESINFYELLWGHCQHATEYPLVYYPDKTLCKIKRLKINIRMQDKHSNIFYV